MSRLRSLYARYAERHFRLDRPGRPLPGPLGHLDRIRIAGGRLVAEGWTEGSAVTLSGPGLSRRAVPSLPRTDVADAHGLREDTGFRIDLPWQDDAEYALEIGRGPDSWTLVLPSPGKRALRAARARLAAAFARDSLRALPHLPRAFLFSDTGARRRVKDCLRLSLPPSPAALEHRLFDCRGLPPGPAPVPVTIVLPVYNAFELLQDCLARVEAHTDLPWHLILVEDASPDPRVRDYLRVWAAERPTRVTLLENDENLGFIGSVNRGLARALRRGSHVVLLNSDALVPADWASRLLRPMLVHPDIASVTPMSNDATILSAPVICQTAELRPGEAEVADRVARTMNPEACLSVLPTGVGFCMALNHRYLRRVPRLDPAFGRGYGEEVDWCQRTRALGGRHLGLPGLFVEHRGGTSFGSEAKRALIRRNNRIVSARYPAFDGDVQRFIATDPLATPRLALGIAMLADRSQRPVPLYVAHSLGGGAESWLQARIAGDLIGGACALVLRLGGKRRWRIELHGEDGVTAGDTDDFDFVLRLLRPVARLNLVYSCAVGDPDPAGLPELLARLLRPGRDDRLEVLFHDYFPLSPSYTLTGADGLWRGDVAVSTADRAHSCTRPDGTPVDLPAWRAAWGGFLAAARRVTVFSQDSRDRVLAAYPALDGVLRLRPHDLLHPVARLAPAPAGAREVIGVLGNIGAQKGAAVLCDMAARLGAPGLPRLVLIGNIDPAYALPPSVEVTGSYAPADIAILARRHGITRWLIPSVWPETFSFTTHETLATGLPVHAFAIGAQGAAVAAAPNGIAVPFDPDADLVAAILATLPVQTRRSAA